MAMTWIWTGMVVLSLVFGLFTGNLDAVADAAMDGAASAVELSVSMAGILCLWSGTASDELCLLVVLNTASIQLLPATIASVRSASGAQSPFDILPAVWLASALSVVVGVLTAKFLAAVGRCRR